MSDEMLKFVICTYIFLAGFAWVILPTLTRALIYSLKELISVIRNRNHGE